MSSTTRSAVAACAFFLISLGMVAQKKVVVMGSSTAFGAAATSGDSSWVGRMQNYYRRNTGDGQDTVFNVVGGYGWVTYFMMPSTYTPPPGRPSYQAGANVDAALVYTPDIIIINLPTNDMAAGYTKKEMMDNLRFLKSYVLSNGVSACFVATTQPRNDLTNERRDSLLTLVDSINNNFGLYAINFWDDLVTNDGQNNLKDEVRHLGFPDAAYHLNDLGHRYIFTRARDKNIFAPNTPLPLKLISFKGAVVNKQVKLNWATEMEEPNTVFEVQYSSDAFNYLTAGTILAKGSSAPATYNWSDLPLNGDQHFYRLKISESSRVSYSKVLHLQFKADGFGITKLYMNGGSTLLNIQLNTSIDKKISVQVSSASGTVVWKQNMQIGAPYKHLEIPVGKLAAGQYFLQVISDDGQKLSRAFIK